MESSSKDLNSVQKSVGAAKRRIKAHTKSRAGCISCKQRRIKCQETRPSCFNCQRASIECIYDHRPQVSRAAPSTVLRAGRSTFSLTDMRYFHDFLTTAHPHLPWGMAQVWVTDVPVIAQQHEFLMHAILALGASHSHCKTDTDLTNTVGKHRSLAMQGLNSVGLVSEGFVTLENQSESLSDALLATCYALTFTASFMGDSMFSFLVLVRGCASLTHDIEQSGKKSLLHPSSSLESEYIKGQVQATNDILDANFKDALISLLLVRNEFELSSTERTFWDLMYNSLLVTGDPLQAYLKFVEGYNFLSRMPHGEFLHLASIDTDVCPNLLTHFIAIEALFRPWIDAKDPHTETVRLPGRNTVKAVLHEYNRASIKSKALMKWPLSLLGIKVS